MEQTIEEEELLKMDDETLLKRIKDKGVFLHLYNGEINEGRVKKIIVSENSTSMIEFYTTRKTFRSNIKRIEIIDYGDSPIVL